MGDPYAAYLFEKQVCMLFFYQGDEVIAIQAGDNSKIIHVFINLAGIFFKYLGSFKIRKNSIHIAEIMYIKEKSIIKCLLLLLEYFSCIHRKARKIRNLAGQIRNDRTLQARQENDLTQGNV